MAKQLASVLATLALASTLLAGCGATSGTGVTASIKSASATTVKAKDYSTVTNAQRIASNALYQYNNLRNQWLASYSDAQKDRIEDRMLVVLSGAIGQVRDAVSAEAGASGYDSAQVFNIADSASNQYESLRYQWSNTSDINQQRVISNQMQSILVGALQQVQNVRPY